MSQSPVDDSLVGLEPEVDVFIRALLERAAAIRLPELFATRPADALYWVGNRHGVTTVALRTPARTPEQLVEEIFGRGLFDRLRILPDLPVDRVREAGRLMKSHRHEALDELVTRAPVEVLVGVFGLARGALHYEIDACIGDLEINVAKKNQEAYAAYHARTPALLPAWPAAGR